MDKGYARPTARARELRHNATAAERMPWHAISARRIADIRFTRQVPIGPSGASCRKVGTGFLLKRCENKKLEHAACVRLNAACSICDFVARSIGLVIKVDGGQHSDAADASRSTYLLGQGCRVIRLRNNDVLGNPDGVIAEITRVIADMPSPDPSRKREESVPCP